MIHLDLGYFDEWKYEKISVSINGCHGQSHYISDVLDLPPREHPPIKDWKHDGQFIQIVEPGYKMGKWKGVNSVLPMDWSRSTAAKAIEAFGKPAKIRHHPRNAPPGTPGVPPFETTFAETFCSVSFYSTASIQTVLEGIPTVAMHPRNVAYPMGTPLMEAVRPAGREAWAHVLAHREYYVQRPEEIKAAADFIRLGYEQCRREGGLGDPQRIEELHDFTKEVGPV